MIWLKGLISAIIGGAASGITLMLVNPESFNFSDFSRLGLVVLVSGIVSAAAYLKQSPLP